MFTLLTTTVLFQSFTHENGNVKEKQKRKEENITLSGETNASFVSSFEKKPIRTHGHVPYGATDDISVHL